MNNDSSSAAEAGPGAPRPPPVDAAPAPSVSPAAQSSSNDDDGPEARLRKRTTIQTKKRSEFIHDIAVNLDMLIYAELCYMYYLDCSFLRLFLRTMIQLVFLSPVPKTLPPFAGHRPYVPAILGSNGLCILLHLLTARPSAGELTRGYLHGGILIDFIGQQAPSSKALLVLLDMVILALQVFMLAVHIEEDRLKAALASKESITEFIANGGLETAIPDLDAEERGVTPRTVQSTSGIELQNLASSGADAQTAEERDALLAEHIRRAQGEGEAGPLDIFYSGNTMVGDFHVLETMRRQYNRQDNAASAALLIAGHTAGYEWTRASRGITRRLDTLR